MMSMNCMPLLAMDESSTARLPAAKARMRNRPRSNIGSSTWSSMKTKATSNAAPPAMAPITNGLDQPVMEPACGRMPYDAPVRIAAMPAANVMLPSQSMCVG